jgi:hypothetical protein
MIIALAPKIILIDVAQNEIRIISLNYLSSCVILTYWIPRQKNGGQAAFPAGMTKTGHSRMFLAGIQEKDLFSFITNLCFINTITYKQYFRIKVNNHLTLI